MDAHHGLGQQHRVGLVPGEVAVDPQPVHLAAPADLVLADDRHVVLGLAGDEARGAADAGIQVDRHPPLRRRGQVGPRLDVGGMLALVGLAPGGEVGDVADLHQLAFLGRVPLELVVGLRRGERVSPAGPGNLQAGRDIGACPGAKFVRIEAGPLGDATDGPTVAERNTDAVVGVARGDHRGDLQRPAVEGQLHEVAVVDFEGLGRRGAEQRGVVPAELGDGVGGLLEPAVVGIAAVVDARIARVGQLQRVERRGRGPAEVAEGLVERLGLELGGHVAPLGAGAVPFVEELPPGRLDVGPLADDLAERAAGQLEGRRGVVPGQLRHDFQGRLAAEQGLDLRLDGHERPVGGAAEVPRLQVVRLGQVPGRREGGLVPMHADADAGRHLLQQLAEVEIRRGVVRRVPAQDDERVDLVLADRPGQQADGLAAEVGRRAEGDRRAEVPQSGVHGVNQGMNDRRLPTTGDDDPGLGVRLQVGGDFFDPARVDVVGDLALDVEPRDQLLRQREGVAGDLPGRHAEAVVGHAAGGGERRLDGVEADDRGVALAAGRPGRGEAPDVVHADVLDAQNIGVQGQDDGGFLQVVARYQRGAEGEQGPLAGVALVDGAVGVPVRLGQGCANVAAEEVHRRGVEVLGEEPQARAAGLAELGEVPGREVLEGLPGGVGPAGRHPHRPVGVVHRQDRRLGEGVGRAPAGGDRRVALQLRGPAPVGLGQQGEVAAGAGHGGGVVGRQAGDHILGDPGVGQDRDLGASAAGGPREGDRGAHQAQEAAAVQGLAELVGVLGDQPGVGVGAARALVEAPPVVAAGVGAHRWQVPQVCWTLMPEWALIASPSSTCLRSSVGK